MGIIHGVTKDSTAIEATKVFEGSSVIFNLRLHVDTDEGWKCDYLILISLGSNRWRWQCE